MASNINSNSNPERARLVASVCTARTGDMMSELDSTSSISGFNKSLTLTLEKMGEVAGVARQQEHAGAILGCKTGGCKG